MKTVKIADRMVGESEPCYIVVEVSCNHEGSFDEAKRIIEVAGEAGADAVKLQTYTADTLTRDFKVRPSGTMWDDLDLYKLYDKAHTPWDWYPNLAQIAREHEIHLFSTPFDEIAVDFLIEQDVPVIKLASFEVVDTKLVEKIAKAGRPVIMSTGMTEFYEIKTAVDILRENGCADLIITHCNSGYPASFDEVNLHTMRAIGDLFDVVVGLSDHTIFADDVEKQRPMAHVTPLEAVKLGASVIEVHLLLDRAHARELNSRNEGGFDWPFSREPEELKKMVAMIREFEARGKVEYDTEEEAREALRTHGTVRFDPTEKEVLSRQLRPSLWVVRDISAGEKLKWGAEDKAAGNFDSIRPADGLPIVFADYLDGKTCIRDVAAGSPLSWDMISTGDQ